MSARQKKEAFLLVSEEISTRGEAAFKGISNKNKTRNGVAAHPFYVARHAEHIRSMFGICWMPVLAGISAPLQEADAADTQTTTLCMHAFRSAIHLAAIFDLDLERNALVSTLTKYAQLNAATDLVFKPKHVESIRALLEIAYADGNWLRGSWLDVLRCVSALERWVSAAGKGGLAYGSGSETSTNGIIPGVAVGIGSDGIVPAVVSVPSTNDFEKGKRLDKKKSELLALTKEDESQIAATAQSILVAMDRIFTASVRLSGVCYYIIDFS
jgi:brefeldin A-inhibited guanine nucleotide-exchange protein